MLGAHAVNFVSVILLDIASSSQNVHVHNESNFYGVTRSYELKTWHPVPGNLVYILTITQYREKRARSDFRNRRFTL